MKRTVVSVVLASATCLVIGGCAADGSSGMTRACVLPQGTATAVDDTTAEALREVLQDERRAQAYYAAVIAKHGRVRPFVNIVRAEDSHEAAVIALMNRHDVPVPGDSETVPAVAGTLAECNRAAAQIERDNIGMYDRLLGSVKEPDVRGVFANLRAASQQNHLPAFERWEGAAGSPAVVGGRARGNAGVCPGVCCDACVGPCTAAR